MFTTLLLVEEVLVVAIFVVVEEVLVHLDLLLVHREEAQPKPIN
jgi:hypothetical protein